MNEAASRSAGLSVHERVVAAMTAYLRSQETTLTVSGLCKRAGVGRTSFYRRFTDLDDVVTRVVQESVARLGHELAGLSESVRSKNGPAPEVETLLLNVLASGNQQRAVMRRAAAFCARFGVPRAIAVPSELAELAEVFFAVHRPDCALLDRSVLVVLVNAVVTFQLGFGDPDDDAVIARWMAGWLHAFWRAPSRERRPSSTEPDVRTPQPWANANDAVTEASRRFAADGYEEANITDLPSLPAGLRDRERIAELRQTSPTSSTVPPTLAWAQRMQSFSRPRNWKAHEESRQPGSSSAQRPSQLAAMQLSRGSRSVPRQAGSGRISGAEAGK